MIPEILGVQLGPSGSNSLVSRAVSNVPPERIASRMVSVWSPFVTITIFSEVANRIVYDKGRVFNLRSVKRMGFHVASFGNKNSVAAVFASAHDEICHSGLFSVGSFAYHYSASDIRVSIKYIFYSGLSCIRSYRSPCQLLLCSASLAATFSQASGRIIHSAFSITLFCSTSGVSPSSMQTAR